MLRIRRYKKLSRRPFESCNRMFPKSSTCRAMLTGSSPVLRTWQPSAARCSPRIESQAPLGCCFGVLCGFACLCQVGIPTEAGLPHAFGNAFRNVASLIADIDFTFKEAPVVCRFCSCLQSQTFEATLGLCVLALARSRR